MPMTDSYQASHGSMYPARPVRKPRPYGMPHPRATWNVHWPVFRSALRSKKGPFVHKHIHFTFERYEDGSISIRRTDDEAAMNFLMKHEALHRMHRTLVVDRSSSMSDFSNRVVVNRLDDEAMAFLKEHLYDFSDRGGTDMDSAIDAIRALFGGAK